MRRSLSILVVLCGSVAWTGVQAQSAAPDAAAPAPAVAPAAAPTPTPTPTPAPTPEGPGAEPAAAPPPVEATGEPPPPAFAPAFPVPKYEKPPEPTEWDQPTFPPPQAARSRRSTEAGFDLQVPIWFTPDDGAIDPGFGFAGRFGLLVGRYLVPELHLGWQINWMDEDVVGFDRSMDIFYFSVGARVRFDSGGLVTPFVSGAFDMSFVHFEGDEDVYCGGYYYYYCDTVANYEFTPGFSAKVGVAFEMSRDVAIDVGARIAMVFETDVFPQAEGYVSPFVGLTFYN
jgi:hypothetical protein